jgi:alpha-D-ribose 1-methylphosphonate 5-phosphate C-P lyase
MKVREEILRHCRAAMEFQIALGGRQVLIGWGSGERIVGVPEEVAWKTSVLEVITTGSG